MRIAIYARKSRMTDQGESIANQITLCRQYAAFHFQNPEFDEYQDEGYSGGNINRPAFKKMMDLIEKKNYDVLICYRLDRISRNVLDFSSTLKILTENTVDFVSIKENFDTTTPMGRAMLNISSVFAQLERETIAERIRDNMYELAKTGRWLGGTAPLGYKSTKSAHISINGHTKHCSHLEIDSSADYIVKLIFEKYLTLGSLSALETYLIKHQIKSQNNNYFRPGTLRSILSNPVYCAADLSMYNYYLKQEAIITNDSSEFLGTNGLMVYNKNAHGKSANKNPVSKWIIAIGNHPPLISSDVWLEVQSKLSDNCNKAIPTNPTHTALCSSLIYCGAFGAPMKVTNQSTLKNGSKSYIYRCSNKLKSHGILCNINNAKGHLLDRILLNTLKEGLQYNTLQDAFKNQLESQSPSTDMLDHEITDLEVQIEKCDKTISKLVLLLTDTDDVNLMNSYKSEIKNQNEQKQIYQRRLNESQLTLQSIENTSINIDYVLNGLEYFLEYFDKMSVFECQMLLKTLIHHIEWTGSGIKVYFFQSEKGVELNNIRNIQNGCKISYEEWKTHYHCLSHK